MSPRASSRLFGALLSLPILAITGAARAQCAMQWLPGPALAGTDLDVFTCVKWDPDGVGPRTPVVVLGGDFMAAGNIVASRIVAFDPATNTWSAFGTGLNDTVQALAVLSNGDLVAGGAFTTAGGVAANRVARWDGTAWSAFGSGTDGEVLALAALPNGGLAAGGSFANAGGAAANCIARWNGVAWSPLGTGVGGFVNALAVLPSGDVVA